MLSDSQTRSSQRRAAVSNARCEFIIRSRRWRKTINGASLFLGLGPVVFPPIPADRRILFYHRDKTDFGFLSNFFPAPFVINGQRWPTVEHYYQAQKSLSALYRETVRCAPTPGQAKRLGALPNTPVQRQSLVQKNPSLLRDDWEAQKLAVMQLATTAKFAQNGSLGRQLLATKAAELVEDSVSDIFWGIGADCRGSNWLGRVLMEVRASLKAQSERNC